LGWDVQGIEVFQKINYKLFDEETTKMLNKNRSFRKRFFFRCPLGPNAIGMNRFISYWKHKWSPLHTYDVIRWEPNTYKGCVMIEVSGMTILHFENTVLSEPVTPNYLMKEMSILDAKNDIPLAVLINSVDIKQSSKK